MSSAEAIAKVVRDIRRGTFMLDEQFFQLEEMGHNFRQELQDLANEAIVVDVSTIYENWKGGGSERQVYEDYKSLNPPWMNAFLGYENSVGNVIVMHSNVLEGPVVAATARWDSESGTHEIEWDRVKWVYSVMLFSGGRHSSGLAVPTVGPLIWYRMAVYNDGSMADLHWRIMDSHFESESTFDNAAIAFLDTIDICNCVNVVTVERQGMGRPERKRLSRFGVTINEIVVRPVSQSYRGKGGPPASHGVPLTSVRGHFAEYGPAYRKGLLFGKYAGRFWIPQHARGEREHGVSEQSYTVEDA